MLRYVGHFPDLVANLHIGMWCVGRGNYPASTVDLRKLDDGFRTILNQEIRISSELPILFWAAGRSAEEGRRFGEVFPALQRESRACIEGLTRLRTYLEDGLDLPSTSGNNVRIPFSMVFETIDIEQPKHILKMAAEDTLECFAVDEAAEALRDTALVVEEYIVGDKFENISNSTIISRSHVEQAFNRTKERLGEEVATAILRIAEHVNLSKNAAAGVMFDGFVREVDKGAPDKPQLRQLWDGLVAILPSVTSMTGAAASISKLFL